MAYSAENEMNASMKMQCYTICILVLLFVVLPLRAQDDETEYRMELGAGLGLHTGLNDVNSKLFGKSQFGGGVVARFLLNPRMAVKTALTYGKISGDVKKSSNFYPAQPNLTGTERLDFSAKGACYDLSALYEINFIPYGYYSGYQGYHRFVPYLQMGLGFTLSDASNAFSMNVPFGIGVKYKIGRRLNLGFEWRMHFTLSDKLEGLEAPLGIASSEFRNKDHYSFTLLTVTYDLSPRCPTCNKD